MPCNAAYVHILQTASNRTLGTLSSDVYATKLATMGQVLVSTWQKLGGARTFAEGAYNSNGSDKIQD